MCPPHYTGAIMVCYPLRSARVLLAAAFAFAIILPAGLSTAANVDAVSCVRAAPSISPTVYVGNVVAGGKAMTTITVTNKDTKVCAATSFGLRVTRASGPISITLSVASTTGLLSAGAAKKIVLTATARITAVSTRNYKFDLTATSAANAAKKTSIRVQIMATDPTSNDWSADTAAGVALAKAYSAPTSLGIARGGLVASGISRTDQTLSVFDGNLIAITAPGGAVRSVATGDGVLGAIAFSRVPSSGKVQIYVTLPDGGTARSLGGGAFAMYNKSGMKVGDLGSIGARSNAGIIYPLSGSVTDEGVLYSSAPIPSGTGGLVVGGLGLCGTALMVGGAVLVTTAGFGVPVSGITVGGACAAGVAMAALGLALPSITAIGAGAIDAAASAASSFKMPCLWGCAVPTVAQSLSIGPALSVALSGYLPGVTGLLQKVVAIAGIALANYYVEVKFSVLTQRMTKTYNCYKDPNIPSTGSHRFYVCPTPNKTTCRISVPYHSDGVVSKGVHKSIMDILNGKKSCGPVE